MGKRFFTDRCGGTLARQRSRRFAMTVGLVALAFGTAGLQPPADNAAVPPESEPAPTVGVYYGTFSCAAAACHGSSQPDPRAVAADNAGDAIRRDELVQWVTHDPHAKSASIMEGERWKTIVNVLHQQDDTVTADRLVERSCLPCHGMHYSPRRGATSGESLKQQVYVDGVGCESCHGPASGWIGIHFREDFQRMSDNEKRQLGYADTKSAWERADKCVQCHVAHPNAEVNHTLIAAGHPRLQFDFATYFARLPAHWNVTAEYRRQGGERSYWPRLWAIGRIAEAIAYTKQLEARAGGAAPNRWPDLSDYDCYACHHQLDAAASWRRDRAWGVSRARSPAGAPLVAIPASPWSIEPARQMAVKACPPVATTLSAVPRSLESSLIPNRTTVAGAADAATNQLVQWRKSLQGGALNEQLTLMLEDWNRRFREDRAGEFVQRWDTAVQAAWYLETVLHQKQLTGDAAHADEISAAQHKLEELTGLLFSSPDVDSGRSPTSFIGDIDDSSSVRGRVRALLVECYRRLQDLIDR